jgi:hypothetical protein
LVIILIIYIIGGWKKSIYQLLAAWGEWANK